MAKFLVRTLEETIVSYEVEADSEDLVRDMLVENLLEACDMELNDVHVIDIEQIDV